MSVLENIAAQRQKLLDGIDANEGDINLRIFEDFYPDEAHFIYELLQNAEDAGATEVAFELTTHACNFEHNGSRHFDEGDIRGITGIFNSSKKDSPDKIGKFGVGFKSVFVYTETPVIYSKDYSFKILKLVLPQPVSPKDGLGEKTRFEIPFNNPKKNAKAAFSEIKAGLEQLSATTLLFLNNIGHIKWKVCAQEGAVRRVEHSATHVEVLKFVGAKELLSSHWLRFAAPVQNLNKFTAPVEGIERQKVAVAFELGFLADTKSFDGKKALAKQLKIVPAVRGKVSVFFPAEKETSGLRFHLHAPFIPELSRASIKSSPENLPLFEQLAAVAAHSLHEIKALGLLTGEFLSVLPNNDDSLPEKYALIRKALLDEMRTEPLVPKYGGGFAPAIQLCQARASIKALLSTEDLAFVTERNDQPRWAISATQKNSNQDRLLASLGIQRWDTEDLKNFLESRVLVTSNNWTNEPVDPTVIKWLAGKSPEWHQAFYALLNKYCEDEDHFFSLSETKIVRMADGSYSLPTDAYFQTGPSSTKDPLPRVDEQVFEVGAKKTQQADAKRFLTNIGVKIPGELEEVKLLLQSRYTSESRAPSDKVYLADLKRLMDFADKNPQSKQLMEDAFLFRVDSSESEWSKAKDAYLDNPIANTGLRTFYDSVKDGKSRKWPLSAWYKNQPIALDKLVKFAGLIGIEREFLSLYVEINCEKNAKYSYLIQVAGERNTSPINRDFTLTQRAYDMLRMRTVEGSRLVWSAMCNANPHVLQACFQRNESSGAHFADSQLVCWLRDHLAWVPQGGDSFVKPRQATAEKLPEGFAVDAGFKWLRQVDFGADERNLSVESTARASKRAELGFKSDEDYQRALEFSKFSKDEQIRVLSSARNEGEQTVELPDRPVRNPELRAGRVGEQARATPEKSTVIRPRSVQLGADAARAEAKLYLTDHYTNTNGQMICQACKDELPFKLPNGAYFFEAVEIVLNAPKRFREGYLALCPNHAAAYQHANAQRNAMHEIVDTAASNEIEIALGGIETTIYFTQMHLADVRACLASAESDEASPS